MRTGSLRHYVSVQSRTETQSAVDGSTSFTWTTDRRIYAAIKPLRGNERFQAQAVNPEMQFNVKVRHFDGMSNEMRLLVPTNQNRSLSSGINDTDTSITLGAAFDRFRNENFYCRIEDEEIEVTGGHATTSLTVSRGLFGSSGAAHSSGKSVSELLIFEVVDVVPVMYSLHEIELLCSAQVGQ